MKVEIVTDTFVPDVNGVAMTLGRLTAGLRERGHQVQVMHTGDTARPGEYRAFSLSVPGYSAVRVGLPKPFELRARWLKTRPDVVYVATEGFIGRAALRAAKVLGIPVVTGFHTNFHEYAGEYRLGLIQPLALASLRGFHMRADCTLVPSADVMDRLSAAGFERLGLLGRGVDTEMFTPSERCETLRSGWGARAGSPVAMVVGRLAPEKNLVLAMAVFERMRRTVPDVVCVVVGDGPLRSKLADRHPWVRFVGSKTGSELARHYASADVLVFPSRTETFGNVLLEGMASGLATVSFKYAASALHVTDGVNGFHFGRECEEDFMRRSVEALALRPGHPLRQAARETAESLGWDKVVSEFESRLARVAGVDLFPTLSVAEKTRPPRLSCRTVFLSDIHLGTPDSKADEVVDFLKRIRCAKLVLNGDIVDGWALKRGGRWSSSHSRVIRRILKMTERDETEVVYLRGNHDEILERFLPMAFGRIRLTKEHIHVTRTGMRYLVVHGDGFDSVSTRHKWLASLGAVGYDFLLRVNRLYNHYRSWRGMEYYSLSKAVKAKVKSAVCFVDRYEELLQDLARLRKCDGIICGHIHTPEDKQVGGIHYLNSGDWVESLTAILEHEDGRMEVVKYPDFINHRLESEQQPEMRAARQESRELSSVGS